MDICLAGTILQVFLRVRLGFGLFFITCATASGGMFPPNTTPLSLLKEIFSPPPSSSAGLLAPYSDSAHLMISETTSCCCKDSPQSVRNSSLIPTLVSHHLRK